MTGAGQELRFAGYAALFDRRDAGGDVIRKGAFARTLAESATPIPLFWQHRPEQRIGWVETIAEDSKGLRVVASIDKSDGGAAASLRQGKATGLSFGYRARGFVRDDAGRVLTDIQLLEVSLVTHPMQHRARVHLVERSIEQKFNQRHYRENGQFARAGEGVLYGGLAAATAPAQMAKEPNSISPRYPARNDLYPYPVRIRLPENKPRQADKPVIRFPHSRGIDLPDSVVSKANTLSDAVRTATGHQIHVTSGRRTPARQAAAMYNNFVRRKGPHYLNQNAFEEVRRAYQAGADRGLDRNRTIASMAGVLSKQMQRGVYLSRHMRSGALDIRTPSSEVLRAIRQHPSVQSVLVEDDHIHIQFH